MNLASASPWGPQLGDITRIVLGSGAKLAFIGSVIGLAGAVGVSKLIASAFPQMQLDHGTILIGASVALVAVALIASYLPARSAACISPVEALRAD